MPGASGVRSIDQTETLGAGEARRLLTTGSGAGSWGGTNAGAARKRWSTARIGGAAAIVVLVVALVAVLRGRGAPSPAAPSSTGIAAEISVPESHPASTAAPPVSVTAEPVASAAPPSAEPEASHAPLAPVGAFPKRFEPKGAKPTPSASTKRPSAAPTFDPTGVIDPFQ